MSDEFEKLMQEYYEVNDVEEEVTTEEAEETDNENITISNEHIDYLAEIRDYMDEYYQQDLNLNEVETPEQMNKHQANFYIMLYKRIIEEETEMNSICDEELKRLSNSINEYRDKRQREFDYKKQYFITILQQYAISELEGKNAKSVKLPYGNLSFKKQQNKYVYEDEVSIKDFLKNNVPELIKVETVEKLDKAGLKKTAKVIDGKLYINGTLIPDVHVEVLEDKFEIKNS